MGLQSTWFLGDTVSFAEKLGKTIHVFNIFDEIFEHEGFAPQNAYEEIMHIGELLDGYQYQFQMLRKMAYLSIARKIDKLPDTDNVIIRIPVSIEWRGMMYELKDHRLIAEYIKPNKIITLIDAEWKMLSRLDSNYGKLALQAVTHQKDVSIQNVLSWLGAEVSRSEDWAEWASVLMQQPVSHHVLGIEVPSYNDRILYVRDVDNMMKLATEKDIPTFYASYSMTVADKEARNEIHNTIWNLRNYGVVLDPASIEIGQNIDKQNEAIVFAYTVRRDLNWYVQKVDIVSAFHPYSKMPPLSTGMMDELGHARAFQKERYLVLPSGGGSPFTGDNYVPKDNLFKDTESFFTYLQSKRKPALKPIYSDVTAAFSEYQDSALLKKDKASN